jgi:hypothetical protein
MINLLEELWLTNEEISLFSKVLKRQLGKASQTYDLIHTAHVRGVGKTTTLIDFAKDNGYGVIVGACELKKDCYDYIYTIRDLNKCSIKNVVIDEGVDIKKVTEMGFKVITGFCNNKEADEINFDNQVLSNLKKEIRELNRKIAKAREMNDVGTYKNLIMAYKEILNIIKEQENIGNNPLNCAVNFIVQDTLRNAEEIGKALKDLSFQAMNSTY